MLFSKKPSESLTPTFGLGAARAQSPKDTDVVIDTLAHVLRALGRHPIATEEVDASTIERTFEAWTQHALVGASHPEQRSIAGDRRDWAGLRRFVTLHRRREAEFVGRALSDLRKTVWTFVNGLHQSLSEDGDADARVRDQLARLRVAAEFGTTEEIRREAMAAVAVVGRAVEERSARQRAQVAEFGAQIVSLGEQLEHAKRAGELDPLTRIFNRGAFDEYLTKTASLHGLFAQPASLLMFDIDRFKGINDENGHSAGDAVLCQVGDALARAFPRKGDFVARFGGEEFAVVLRDANLRDATMLAERVRSRLRTTAFAHAGKTLSVTVSIGVAQLQPGESAARWLDRADRALYRAKDQGRDRVVTDDPSAMTPKSAAVL